MKRRLKRALTPIYKIITNLIIWFGSIVVKTLPTNIWFQIKEKTQIVRFMDYDRVPIKLSVDSWIENDMRVLSCSLEPSTIEWIEKWFHPGDVFYDVGANVGAYSLVSNAYLMGDVKVYAFEPGFLTFPQLCKNIYLNNASNAITPVSVALSNRTSIMLFHYENLMAGGALHALGESVNYLGDQFQPVFSLPVISYRLVDFVRLFDLPFPNHIKIDVDGTEYQILEGAKEILNRKELRSVLLEFIPTHQNSKKIDTLLTTSGFVLDSFRDDNNLYIKRI